MRITLHCDIFEQVKIPCKTYKYRYIIDYSDCIQKRKISYEFKQFGIKSTF